MEIQWFPGHMARARRLVQENLKLVDAVFELVDARIPESSRNPLISELLGDKPRLVVLSKSDLADPRLTRAWINWFHARETVSVAVDLVRGQGINQVFKALSGLIQNRVMLFKHGAVGPRLPRCMVVGIPNVGKSMFINRMAGQKAARTGCRPGVTRGQQWVRIGKRLELLDLPGVLWPQLGDREAALKLAVTGAIKEEVFDPEEVVVWFLEWMIRNHSPSIKKHYNLEELPRSGDLLMELIGKKRGFFTTGGAVDRLRAAVYILKEFREGKLGCFTLEVPNL